MEMAKSRNNVPIRLTEERWHHIVENHDDLAGYYDEVLSTVDDPDYIVQGYREAITALKEVEKGRFLAVVYKELGSDGFIITAYFSSKVKIEKEVVLWQKKS